MRLTLLYKMSYTCSICMYMSSPHNIYQWQHCTSAGKLPIDMAMLGAERSFCMVVHRRFISRSVILISSTLLTGCTSMDEAECNAFIHCLYSSMLSAANWRTPSRLVCFSLKAHWRFTSVSFIISLPGRKSFSAGVEVVLFAVLLHSRKLLRTIQYSLVHCMNRSRLYRYPCIVIWLYSRADSETSAPMLRGFSAMDPRNWSTGVLLGKS